MRVIFAQYGQDIACATMMVESCKRLGYEVWQLADETAPAVPGVDWVARRKKSSPSMLWRYERVAAIEPPFVLLDTDMIVRRDISDGFADDADASLSWREKHDVIDKDTGKVLPQPYNGGLVFVRNRRFIAECLRQMQRMRTNYQEWQGDQVALRDVAPRFKIRELREPQWNFVPEYDNDGMFDESIRIYHFKGHRKRFMRNYFDHFYSRETT